MRVEKWSRSPSIEPHAARRLHTILERVVEDVSFDGPDLENKHVVINGATVREKIGAITQKEDLSKYIL